MTTRILVVDDEQQIRSVVRSYLEADGYDVVEASDGESAIEAARRWNPDMVILDVMLPGLDGIEVLRNIRTFSEVYVIMLTARAEETDKVVGLAVGADDYLTKPFSPRELAARVKAVLRRARSAGPVEARMTFGSLTIDADRHVVQRAGADVALTPLEFALLEALASQPGRVFSRRQLIERVWGWDYYGDERVVDVHIRNLRRALDDNPEKPTYVATVRGIGYKFVAGS